ncbi:SDR family oxidoreductase [Altererythrobacter confluentis]|uniref:SDR family oxidoreductase n=1 Tax=Allopontixanthobacter confluentis TaxID=1849021 RepID=A0A6L7GEE3_9SPHN|nr:SDR family oxidoreductase [Allopontixanthobacter confluentis]MXP14413.1 SDR family oxidoreductase [Allopontixanthobacter confluentis]
MTRPAVLVTGAGRRIGAEIARTFGHAGWHVIIHYGTSSAQAEALAAALPSAETFCCDLADETAAVAMVRTIADAQKNWPVLINSASVFTADDAAMLNPETNRAAMQVNARTPVLMAQAFLKYASAPDGQRVIQMTDQKLANPNPDFFSYTMSKHALAASITMMAMDLVAKGRMKDRVYGLAPGAILASHDQREHETEISHKLNLLGRKTSACEVAEAALFLAKGWLQSGETLFVDSGQHLLNQPRDVIYLARESSAR